MGPSTGAAASRALRLTPAGAGAIAVVRLTGARVGEFLRRHFSNPVPPGRCVHGVLADGRRVLDDPVVVVSADGAVADVSLHGGPWVVTSVLELARREGFDVTDAAAGVLPPEAVDAADDLAREVLQYLPLARTELAARVLLAQEAAWAELTRARPAADAVAAVLGDRSLYRLLHPPRVAIVGIPNVGKSALANQLFGSDRAITADVPGTTRDWVGGTANVDGLAVTLVDTPGLRQTEDPIEREAIERSTEQITGADLVVHVLDPTQRGPEQLHQLGTLHPGALRVMNKSDLPSAWGVVAGVIRTVATTGEGVDVLRAAIRRHFLGEAADDPRRPRWWTQRQRAVLGHLLGDAGARAGP